MNKNKLSIFLLLFALIFQANALYSQSLQTVPKIGLGINGLDFSVEIPVARKIIIEPAVGFGPSYDFYQNENQDGLMQLRWYIFNPSVHLSVYGKFFFKPQ